MSESQGSSRGWIVTFAGTGINLALGVLYSWSVIKKGLPAEWNWSDMDKNWPYTIACLVFALMMVPAGKLQDRWGPRIVATAGGVLTGLGLIIASFGQGSLFLYILGFGILAGTGIGFGYASATPPAVKWFPPAKTGMIAGIVVSGFGLASVYISPLSKAMIASFGVPRTLLILGIAFLVVVCLLAQLLVNPPPKPATAAGTAAAPAQKDYTATEMLKTPTFYLMWLMYAFNAGAGLMIIGNLATLVKAQTENHSDAGFLMVAFLAVGNAGGRLLAGTLSDKLGRIRVLFIFTVAQAILMFITPSMSNFIVLILISTLIGMCYGSNLALFPSLTKDYFGLKNFGINYGLVFTAWGVGSIMSLVAGKIYDLSLQAAKAALPPGADASKVFGQYDKALYLAGTFLIVTIILSFVLKKPAETQPAK